MTRQRFGLVPLLAWLLAVSGGCSLPVTVPMAPLMGEARQNAAVNITTGSTGATVEEEGLAERLGPELWRVVRPAVAHAVEYGEDGEPIAWRSQAGASGSVVPVAAYFDADGDVCRRLSITGAAASGPDGLLAEACQEGDLWRVRPTGDRT